MALHRRARADRSTCSAGVKFNDQYALSDFPAEAIVTAARKSRCDGIVMGSHGRSGMSKLLLGSPIRPA